MAGAADKLKEAKKQIREQKAKLREAEKLMGGMDGEAAQHNRDMMAEKSRRQSAAIADIGDIPAVVNPERREACRLDLYQFLTTYFPNTTGLSPFSADHHRVIARIQSCILEGGRYTNAVYRGFAKTTISENAAIWAILYGHRRFVCVFGADATAADQIVDSVKGELEANDLLHEDFPEACHPIRALEGKPQRCASQTYKGELTKIDWTAGVVVLAAIPGAVCASGIFTARGIGGGFRGLKIKTPDGKNQRPDLVIADDPQTDESASTQAQVTKTLNIFRKAVLKLGGHKTKLAVVVNATVIAQGDAISELLEDKAWQGERIAMVKKWPDAHKTLWLEEYAGRRRNYDKDTLGDQERAHKDATAFYSANREAMDAGGEISWESCFVPEHEISAIQHAYNSLIDDGEDAFQSEYQNQPNIPKDKQSCLVAADITKRVNLVDRGTAPSGTTVLTAFVDVQQECLFWVVCGWQEGFGGAVVDYGCFPDQGKDFFTLRQLRLKLSDRFPGGGTEAHITAGLTALVDALALQSFGGKRLDRVMIDTGYLETVVTNFVASSPYAALLTPSKGWGVTAAARDLSEWQPKPGERRGLNWILNAKRTIIYDTNRWKSFVAERLLTPIGGRAGLMLFGDSPRVHQMFADHLTAEYTVSTSGRGREVEQWKMHVGRDNHWWDCLVGCAVGASLHGAQLAEMKMPEAPKRRKVSLNSRVG